MYESFYRLSGLPFQLSPDPSYYYSSEGHRRALSYLKYGVYQGEGFVVVTGEIGAGKTTLVRALIGGLDTSKIVAAQLVSTQLGASDVLRSVLATFGLPVKNSGKAEMLHTVEAFLTSLFIEGKRAILIVDEAQNLPADAIEELRMLSNFQLQDRGLLQSVLVGQPELRDILRSTQHEQLRQRIIASYHLGAMNAQDTQGYVMHRLACVGWAEDPKFDPEAFERIYRYTGGVPRKINRLCNRMLLAAYLAGSHAISADDITDVAREISEEIGLDLTAVRPSKKAKVIPSTPQISSVEEEQAPIQPLTAPIANVVDLSAKAGASLPAFPKASPTWDIRPGTVLCAADNIPSTGALGQFCRVWSKNRSNPPTALVWLQEEEPQDPITWEAFGLIQPAVVIAMGGPTAPLSARLALMESLLQSVQPPFIVVQGDSDNALALALAAHQAGVDLACVDGGLRISADSTAKQANRILIDRLARRIFIAESNAAEHLEREGLAAERYELTGHLLIDALVTALPRSVPPVDLLARHTLPASLLTGKAGYAVADVQTKLNQDQVMLLEIAHMLTQTSEVMPIIWLVDVPTQLLLVQSAWSADTERIVLLPRPSYFESLALIGEAAAVMTNHAAWQAETTALGVPCLALATPIVRPVTAEFGTNTRLKMDAVAVLQALRAIGQGTQTGARMPEKWDAKTALRIASSLSAWVKQGQASAATKASA
jgi:general secretion pathway protein A